MNVRDYRKRAEGMGTIMDERSKPLPEEWFGQPVRVGLATPQQMRAGVGPSGESEPLGTLDAVNESGLVLLQRVEEGQRPVFYPWSCIAWVYPKEEVNKGSSMGFTDHTGLWHTEPPPSWKDAR
jgi:hypothetical protein